jgi:4a-hydroxytetrahydrobiopterin dehydratase
VLTDTLPSPRRYAPLTVHDVATALHDLPWWHVTDSRLQRTLQPSHLWPLLEQVADVEAELDHHSVVTLDAGFVSFAVWTHVSSSLTAADVALARRIEGVVAATQ